MAAATPSCVWAGDLLCEKARPVRVIEGELPELPVLLGMGNSPEGDIFSLESRERSRWDESLESEPTQSAARVHPTEWDILLFVYRHGVCAISVKSAHIPQVMGWQAFLKALSMPRQKLVVSLGTKVYVEDMGHLGLGHFSAESIKICTPDKTWLLVSPQTHVSQEHRPKCPGERLPRPGGWSEAPALCVGTEAGCRGEARRAERCLQCKEGLVLVGLLWDGCVPRARVQQGVLHTRSRALPLLLAGAVLLDLEQTTLPGIAHLMVETMIISDQIRAEDRANVLRALLLKHRWVRHRQGLREAQGFICKSQAAIWLYLR